MADSDVSIVQLWSLGGLNCLRNPSLIKRNMASNIDDYILCADDHSLEEAIGALKSSPEVMMDCEGVDLGQQGGLLSLISLRTMGTEPSKTYLIDVFSLTNDKLRPLFDIIQSTSPTKIVFDGRMDFSELYHGSGITLHGVLDLQLVDVDSRRQRGEDEDEQLRRLSPYLHRREIFGQRNSYTKVHKLCGLGQCLTEHKIDGLGHKSGKQDLFYRRRQSLNMCTRIQ